MNGIRGIALTVVVLLTWVCQQARADDKNGVSPNTISRPTGPGSLEGLGDAFQPTLNAGTARYNVRLSVPTGVAGFTPSVMLNYDSGNGFSTTGIGWTFGPGSIRRQSDKGLPRYGANLTGDTRSDRFLGMNGEELVPLGNGAYLAKVEGSYIRCRQVTDHWEAHTRDGTKLEFGLTDTGRLSDDTGTKIYEWKLERQTDTNGNVIEYDYERPVTSDRQVYCREIRYGPGTPPWTDHYAVRMEYEDRPDAWTDYRSGFRVRTSKRLKRIEVLFNDTLIRRYELGYTAPSSCSYLKSIAYIGSDGVSTLPTTTFYYSSMTLGDPATPISAASAVIGSIGQGNIAMDNAEVEIVDVNADSLPDLLVTDAGHYTYINQGVQQTTPGQWNIQWTGPAQITAVDQRAFSLELAAANVHLADMTGDGVADLVATEDQWVEYFANTGHNGWDVGTLMSPASTPPPAPFGPSAASVVTVDLDFDKRMDIMKSQDGAYSIWYNQGGGSYSPEILVDAVYYLGQDIDFADPGVHMADMNGDRLSDIVKVTSTSVVYAAGMGYGRFDDPVEMLLPDRSLDPSPSGNLHRASLSDLNADGLADLVVERANGNDLWVWFNLGDGHLETSRVVTGLPATANAEVRWADINGNGTTDLIYADSSLSGSTINAVDLGVLLAGTPHMNLLTGIDNGFGRHISIHYKSSTEDYLAALGTANPWTTSLAFPVGVVAATETSIGLDLDGYPDEGPHGDIYKTEYIYRDGYYDPFEKQFRGFAFVKQISYGDERFGGDTSPTLVERHAFHTGAPDGVDNDNDGQVDEYDPWDGREEEPLKGVELWMESTALPDDAALDGQFAADANVFERVENTWEIRDLCTQSAGLLPLLLSPGYQTLDDYGRSVRQAVRTKSQRTIIERQTDSATHKILRTMTDIDPLGNTVFDLNQGDIANPEDDIYTGYEFARNEVGWIVDRVSRIVQKAGDANGAFISDVRNYYDGPSFQGLPLGQIGANGHLHRTEALISDDPVPPLSDRSLLLGDPRDPTGRVDTLRQAFDVYGNVAVSLDADAALAPDGQPDGNGHERRIAYDNLLHKFPVKETVVLGNGQPALEVTAAYDYRFGVPTVVSDFNGNLSTYTYDEFGRLSTEYLPGDPPGEPTRQYEYNWGQPFSSITTVAHAREGASPDITSKKYFDGLGRTLGTFESGGPAMTDVTCYNPRGNACKVYQPYFGQPVDGNGNWQLPSPSVASTESRYDAKGRVIATITPPDVDGARATMINEFLPLKVVKYDGEDTQPGSPHVGTPKTLVYDGLERLIETREIETLSPSDSGVFVTKYRYALPDLLAEIEDANGNVKYMRYDGLARRIYMNDCDRGPVTTTYDAVGNILETVDAKQQHIQFTYDGANRALTEDYVDDASPLSLQRTPDVRYHYDQPSADYPELPNTRGQLAWIEDLTGAQFQGFDLRGNAETVIKRVDQIGGSHLDWSTVTLVDSLGRVYQTVYPDGSVVHQRYDDRGLLASIPGLVDQMTYQASAQMDSCTYTNGVTTTYSYDPRLRMTHLLTQSNTATLQDLSYAYDQADNMLEIADGRSIAPSDPRNQTASFHLDDSYRMQQAVGTGYGTIDYDYDRLGNMVSKTSPDIADPNVHIGTMQTGGLLGTTGRVGRFPGEAPGPHALTSTDNLSQQRTFDYDANGNMTVNSGDQYLFDFKDRLGQVISHGKDIRYLYDYTDRRVIKRVDGVQTTYINKISEVRDGQLIKYVFAGNNRVARIEGQFISPEDVTQRILLRAGWNLISFQVDPGTSDPDQLLADVLDEIDGVYGHNGVDYDVYAPQFGGNTLTAMLPNRGYWVHVNQPVEWFVTGSLASDDTPSTVDSVALVGFAGLAPKAASDIENTLTGVGAVWGYGGDDIGWRQIDLTAPAFLSPLTATAPGRGYWIISEAQASSGFTPPDPPQVFHYHPDHLGSTNTTSDALGKIVSETGYYPFGSPRHEFNAGSSGFNPHYRFGGKERDAESGLQYFGARYYYAPTGKFISTDPLYTYKSRNGLTDPRQFHVYAFAINNPIRYTDPTGLSAWDSIKGAIGVVGSVIEIAGGGALVLAPEPTTLTKIAGGVAIAHGVDNLQASVRQMWTGKSARTGTSVVAEKIAVKAGMNKEDAAKTGEAVNTAVGFVVPGGEINGVNFGNMYKLMSAGQVGSWVMVPDPPTAGNYGPPAATDPSDTAECYDTSDAQTYDPCAGGSCVLAPPPADEPTYDPRELRGGMTTVEGTTEYAD